MLSSISPDVLHRVLSAFNDSKSAITGKLTFSASGLLINCTAIGFSAVIDHTNPADRTDSSDRDGELTIVLAKLYGVVSNARTIASGPLTLKIDAGGALIISSDMIRARIAAAPPASDAAPPPSASDAAETPPGVEVNMRWLSTALKKTASAENGIVRIGVSSKELFIGSETSSSAFVRPAIGIPPAELTMSMDTLKPIVRSSCCGVTGIVRITDAYLSVDIDNAPIHLNITIPADDHH